MKNRSIQRGAPLDSDCEKAKTTTGEYGPNDDRVFCYGLYYRDSDWPSTLEKCEKCGAFVYNAAELARSNAPRRVHTK